MIVVHRDIFEACKALVAKDQEVGHELRSVLAMAMALTNGNVREAANILQSAAVISAIAAGEPLDVYVADAKSLYEVTAQHAREGVVLS
jgi:hypothetical protein